MRNSANIDKTMPHLTALTSTKPPLFCTFWFYLIPKWVFRYLLQTFIWFCLVNTPVTRVAVDVALFWEWLLSVSFLFKNLYWLSTSNFSVNKNMTVESLKMFIWFIASFIARYFNWVVKYVTYLTFGLQYIDMSECLMKSNFWRIINKFHF